MNGKVTVNVTLSLLENSYTKSLVVKRDVQTKLIEVIQVHFFINTAWHQACNTLKENNYSLMYQAFALHPV